MDRDRDPSLKPLSHPRQNGCIRANTLLGILIYIERSGASKLHHLSLVFEEFRHLTLAYDQTLDECIPLSLMYFHYILVLKKMTNKDKISMNSVSVWMG
jgi:hypothetical protein